MSLPRVLFTPTNGMKASTVSRFHLGSEPLLSKISLLLESLCIIQKSSAAVIFFSIWLNCVPIPGTKAGHLGPRRKVCGTGSHYITSSSDLTSCGCFGVETKDQVHGAEQEQSQSGGPQAPDPTPVLPTPP